MAKAYNTVRVRKPLSPGWTRFAEGVVDRVGVRDEEQRELLVQAFASVPRDAFMPAAFGLRAAEDHAFPIGFGQTISKPTTVARMIAVAGIQPGMRVLEIGCGSGYCSAVMAALGAEVFAVEYFGLMAQATRKRLDALGLYRIVLRSGDGKRGWAEHAPYDAIIVSAAFDSIDLELLAQLKAPGGRLVAPIGSGSSQTLVVYQALEKGFAKLALEECRFVEGQ
jgi:protein-L-isoaspartate(D-aspartate) O-methyltransferase